MKAIKVVLVLVLALTLISTSQAQTARFFRISGPADTRILAVNPDGTIVWTNSQPGATFTFQTATAFNGVTNWVDYANVTGIAGVSSNKLFDPNPPTGMAFIPAGKFTMGDTSDANYEGNAAPTNITVSAFYMDVNLVSYSLWQTLYSYATNQGFNFINAGAGKAANHPVQTVDFYDTVKWCNARSQHEGLTPVYYTDAAFTQMFTNGDDGTTVYVNWSAKGYRLPTEAEFEKAARGGLNGLRFPWGNTISESQANYQGETGTYSYDLGPNGYNSIGSIGGTSPATSPVGSFAPNGYGLYDMAGNVFEWCWDWYGITYGQPTANNPTGPTGPLTFRVLRGGDWINAAYACACANRGIIGPSSTGSNFGFRCVRGQ